MQSRFIVSEIANKFHLFQSCTNWHFACRHELCLAFQKEYGEFISVEEVAFLKHILLKYNDEFGAFFASDFFYADSDFSWDRVARRVDEQELQQLKALFTRENKMWGAIWQAESPKLEAWRTAHEEGVKKNEKEILADLKSFYGENELGVFETFILMSEKDHMGGGANLENRGLTVEVSGWEPTEFNVKAALDQYWHEFTHLYADKFWCNTVLPYLHSDRMQKAEKAHRAEFPDLYIFYNEALTYSVFIHYGILSEKYLSGIGYNKYEDLFEKNNRAGISILTLWGCYSSYHLNKIAKEYLAKSRMFDVEYFDKITDLFCEFAGILAGNGV